MPGRINNAANEIASTLLLHESKSSLTTVNKWKLGNLMAKYIVDYVNFCRTINFIYNVGSFFAALGLLPEITWQCSGLLSTYDSAVTKRMTVLIADLCLHSSVCFVVDGFVIHHICNFAFSLLVAFMFFVCVHILSVCSTTVYIRCTHNFISSVQ